MAEWENNMKKVISLILVMMLICLSSSAVFAGTNNTLELSDSIAIEFEIPVNDIDYNSMEPISSIVIYSDGNYDIMSKEDANQIVRASEMDQEMQTAAAVAYVCDIFLDLYFNGSFSEISWQAVCTHSILTQAKGSIVLESTSILLPRTEYFSKSDISVKPSNGTGLVLSGSYGCRIPNDVEKVRGIFNFKIANTKGSDYVWSNLKTTFSK